MDFPMSNSTSNHVDTFTSLYPAIVECFTIILLGYVTGRAKWINRTHAKGLNTFTTSFALPALLFNSMATLDWTVVDWTFIGAIFISKATLFFLVLFVCLLVKRPSNVGLAALAGIFVTQSNDFALGYPIVKAIYGETRPELLQYIYLLAPISLLVLNPIGFVLLELHKASSDDDPRPRNKTRLLKNVLKRIVLNPIIVMTALGVAANFIFSHKLPLILTNLLTTLSDAFDACALFIVGLGIVGKFNKTMTSLLMGSGMLIFVKLLLFPMVAMGITAALDCGSSTNSSSDYSMFAFLYGTFPTAPSVYIYATHYSVGTDLIATSLVLSTVISAPLMFTSAMMVGMQIFPVDVQVVFSQTSLDVAVLTLIFCIAVLLLFIVTKRSTRMPHVMVLLIALFQLLITIGNIIDDTNSSSHSDSVQWWMYLGFALHSVGVLGVSAMTVVTSITIYFISCRSLCSALVLRPWLLSYGLGLPMLIVTMIAIVGYFTTEPAAGLIMFGNVQMISMVAVLVINILISICVLILRQRQSNSLSPSMEKKPDSETKPLCSEDLDDEDDSVASSSSSLLSSTQSAKGYGSCDGSNGAAGDRPPCHSASCSGRKGSLASIEDIIAHSPPSVGDNQKTRRLCPPEVDCERVEECQILIQSYDNTNKDSMYASHYQIGRVVLLLFILLLCQIIVSLYYTWKLFLPNMTTTSVSVEVEFIYIVLNTGQGFFTFLTFGLDSEVVLSPMKRFVLSILRRKDKSQPVKSLPKDDQKVCEQFVEHHLARCQQFLPRLHNSKQDCFTGYAIVSWLVDSGVTADRVEGGTYSEMLLQGRVIRACSKSCHSFQDTKRHIYAFGKLGGMT